MSSLSLFRGFAWMAAAGFAAKAAALAAHVALGWLLSPSEFGLYAIAAGLYVLLEGLQSGGVRIALVARGREAAKQELRNAMLLSLGSHLGIATLMWLGAPVAASLYGEPELVPLLQVMALAVVLNSSWVVGAAVLQNRGQFRRLAGVELADGVARAVLAVVFAVLGLGAMSLVLPLAVLAAYRGAVGVIAVAGEWDPAQAPFRTIGNLATDGGWIVAATLGHALLTQGDYLGLGIVSTTALLGIYYFAYQVPGQLGPMLASGLGDVLVPGLVSRETDGRPTEDLIRPVLIQFATALTLMGCCLAVVFPYVEELLWQGRWSSAILPAQVLALLLPLRFLHVVPKSIYQARRRFRALFAWSSLGGSGLLLVSVLVGAVWRGPSLMAFGIGVYLGGFTLAFLRTALRREGIVGGRILPSTLRIWIVATAIAVGLILVQGVLPPPNPWLAATIAGPVTALVTIGCWRLTAPEAFTALLDLGRRLRRSPRGSVAVPEPPTPRR